MDLCVVLLSSQILPPLPSSISSLPIEPRSLSCYNRLRKPAAALLLRFSEPWVQGGESACSTDKNCLSMVGGGVRRLVREGARGRRMVVDNTNMKELAASNSMLLSARSSSSSSSSTQAILSAKGEVGFNSVLSALPSTLSCAN